MVLGRLIFAVGHGDPSFKPLKPTEVWRMVLDECNARLGEFSENLREVSPSLLDKVQPSAKAVGPAEELPLMVAKSA